MEKLINNLSLPLKPTSIVGGLVIFYWALQVFFYTKGLNRFFFLIPSIFLTGLIFYIISKKGIQRFKRSSYLLFLFLLGSVFTGVYNEEIEIIAATTIFVIPILAVNENFFTIDERLVNLLFIITVIVGIVTFHLSFNEYGYLPGHSYLNGKTPWWRISIFPTSTPTVSGFFALFIFTFNIGKKDFKSKVVKVLTIYFLLLSGSRTAILLFTGVLLFQFLKTKNKIKYWLPYILFVIPLVVLTSQIIFSLSGSEIGQEYLLRGASYEDQEALSSFPRFILWDNLLNLFWENPILGLGSFNFYEYFPFAPSHSESKWLSLLASNGIFTIFLFLFFAVKYYQGVKFGRKFLALGSLIMIISMFYYGSFYNPYNVIYFLNILLFSKDDFK